MSLNKDEFKTLKKESELKPQTQIPNPYILLLDGENILYFKLWLFLIWQNFKVCNITGL